MSTIWHSRDNHSRFGCVLPSDPDIIGYLHRAYHSVETRDYYGRFHTPNAFGIQDTAVKAKFAAGVRPDWPSALSVLNKDVDANLWMTAGLNSTLGKVCVELPDSRIFEGRMQRLCRSSWLYRHAELAEGADAELVDGDAGLFPVVDPTPKHTAVTSEAGVAIEMFEHEFDVLQDDMALQARLQALCDSLEAEGWDEDGAARAGAAATAARLEGKEPPTPTKQHVHGLPQNTPPLRRNQQSWMTPSVPATAHAILLEETNKKRCLLLGLHSTLNW